MLACESWYTPRKAPARAPAIGSGASDNSSCAPTTLKALHALLRAHAKRGYAIIQDAYAPGMSSMAAPVRRKGEQTTGVLVIAGPSARLTARSMTRFGPALMAAADELAISGHASPLLKSANVGTWGNRTGDDE